MGILRKLVPFLIALLVVFIALFVVSRFSGSGKERMPSMAQYKATNEDINVLGGCDGKYGPVFVGSRGYSPTGGYPAWYLEVYASDMDEEVPFLTVELKAGARSKTPGTFTKDDLYVYIDSNRDGFVDKKGDLTTVLPDDTEWCDVFEQRRPAE